LPELLMLSCDATPLFIWRADISGPFRQENAVPGRAGLSLWRPSRTPGPVASSLNAMRLTLVGTEQPHLQVLDVIRAGRFRPGELVVIGSRTWRSPPMLPGLVAGEYATGDVTVDVAALARAAGARFVEGEPAALDAASRRVTLADGRVETGDVVSIALPLVPEAAAAGAGAVRAVAWCDVDALLAGVAAVGQGPVAVVGAGRAGFEVACALASRAGEAGTPLRIRLVDAGDGILADRDPATRRLATRVLLDRKVGLALGARVESLTERGLSLASGASVPASLVVWCTGPGPHGALSASGLALDTRGFAAVDGTLRSTSHPGVFAPGRPDLVHEADVLVHNLAVACGARPGRAMRTYRAPARPAALLHAGRGSAILSFGALARESAWASRLKDRLDRRVVERLQGAGAAGT